MSVKVGETRTSAERCCHIKADIFERSLMVEVRKLLFFFCLYETIFLTSYNDTSAMGEGACDLCVTSCEQILIKESRKFLLVESRSQD